MSEYEDNIFSGLSPEEQEAVKQILAEYSNTGKSKTLNTLYEQDFTEIPVDIDTFIESDEYAGWFTNNGKKIFPYWREKLRIIFDENSPFSEIVLGGCLTGDTMIPLMNGKKVSMKELAIIGDLDEYVYSYDLETNKYVSGHLISAFTTGVKEVYEITLDDGSSFKATSNHRFLTRDKHWKSIDTGLSIGDSLMPLYKYVDSNGYGEVIEDTYNHRIVSIVKIGHEEVYDLTVEKYHNFCLDCGIVAHNSIGCGKSTIAVIGLAYTLYWLMCLKDPNPYFDLGRGDTIYIVFFNATLQLSRGVGYQKFQDLLAHSPWFIARGTLSGTKYIEYTPNKTDNSHIEFTVGSRPEHSLGKAIISGLLDEINFVKGQDADLTKSKIMDTYANVLARIKSRFIINGKVRGRVFLVSSKNTESDFIEAYIRKVKGNPGVFVADARLYELKAKNFCGEKFRVAVGGSNLPSRIIPDNEDNETYISQGYEIEEVPIELKQDFQLDIMRALRDHCGLAISNVTRLISYPSIEQCIIPPKNPFKSNVLTVGMKDTLKYQDFFEPELVPPEVYSKPIFIHFDCSLTGDKTGIGCVAVLGYTNREGFDYITGEHREIKELVYREIFDIGIQCPNGSEISFRKHREFVYYLKYELGWNIRGISLDGYQSADSRQQFETMGFEAKIVSLDKKPDGYLALKSALMEKRLQYLSNQNELTTELVNLKQDNESGKVDHPTDGSKDQADGLAGALYNASLHDGQFAFELVDDAMLFSDLNDVDESESESLLNGLINDPSQSLMERYKQQHKKLPEENPELRDYASDYYNGFLSW